MRNHWNFNVIDSYLGIGKFKGKKKKSDIPDVLNKPFKMAEYSAADNTKTKKPLLTTAQSKAYDAQFPYEAEKRRRRQLNERGTDESGKIWNESGSASDFTPKPTYKQIAKEILTNPIGSFDDFINEENIMPGKPHGGKALSYIVNPFQWAEEGRKGIENVGKGNYLEATGNLLGAAPGLGFLGAAGKGIKATQATKKLLAGAKGKVFKKGTKGEYRLSELDPRVSSSNLLLDPLKTNNFFTKIVDGGKKAAGTGKNPIYKQGTNPALQENLRRETQDLIDQRLNQQIQNLGDDVQSIHSVEGRALVDDIKNYEDALAQSSYENFMRNRSSVEERLGLRVTEDVIDPLPSGEIPSMEQILRSATSLSDDIRTIQTTPGSMLDNTMDAYLNMTPSMQATLPRHIRDRLKIIKDNSEHKTVGLNFGKGSNPTEHHNLFNVRTKNYPKLVSKDNPKGKGLISVSPLPKIKKGRKDIQPAGTSGDILRSTFNGEYWEMPQLFFDNPVQGGRAWTHFKKELPSKSILSSDKHGSLSHQSFGLLIKPLKGFDTKWDGKSFVGANTLDHKNLLHGMSATEARDHFNKLLKKRGLPESAYLDKNSGIMSWSGDGLDKVRLPRYFKQKFRFGGMIGYSL